MRFLRGTATSGAFFSPRIKGQKLPSRRGFARDKAGGVFFICFVLFSSEERERARSRAVLRRSCSDVSLSPQNKKEPFDSCDGCSTSIVLSASPVLHVPLLLIVAPRMIHTWCWV